MTAQKATKVDPEQLMAAVDIAMMCGVSSAAVSNWRSRYPDFPRPVANIANGKVDVFVRDDVIRWWKVRHAPAMRMTHHRQALLQSIKDLDA
jgi:hypothetical protein